MIVQSYFRNIIERAAAIFDELVVVLAENRQKKTLFPLEGRIAMVSQLIKPGPRPPVYAPEFFGHKGAGLLPPGPFRPGSPFGGGGAAEGFLELDPAVSRT